jgi:hypothetical protein
MRLKIGFHLSRGFACLRYKAIDCKQAKANFHEIAYQIQLAKTVVAAAASFRVAEAKEDCEFPTLTDKMDLFYFYSIIVLCPFTVLIFIGLCILRSKMNNLTAGQAPPG